MTINSTVNPMSSVKFNRTDDEAARIHGSLYIHPFIYGSTRAFDNNVGAPYNRRGGIVRVHEETYAYDILRFMAPDDGSHNLYPHAFNHDALCYAGGSLWTTGNLSNDAGSTTKWLFRADPVTWTETGRWQFGTFGKEVIISDGTYIYTMGGNGGYVIKRAIADPGTHLGGTLLCNSSSQPALSAINGTQNFGLHSAVYDDGYLYINNTAGTQTQAWGYLLKVRTSDMQAVGYVEIPVCTDDMTQDESWVYLGVEESRQDRNSEAYAWGTLAVRKSDLARRVLPKLAASDALGVISYASLAFGTYLVDVKNNSHVYVIDKTNPDSWHTGMTQAELGAIVLHDALIDLPDGVLTTPNELLVDDTGYIHSFVWNTSEYPTQASSAVKYAIPGVNLSVAPAVDTLAPTNVSRAGNSATLHGDLTASGGATVIERGFYVGATTPPTTKRPAAGTALGLYSLAVTGLPDSVVYVQAYAINAEGEGRGNVVSMDVGAEPGVFEGFVRLSGSPVQGARVFAIDVTTNAVAATVVTDAAGAYRITGLTSGRSYHLSCEYRVGGEYGSNSKPRRVAP